MITAKFSALSGFDVDLRFVGAARGMWNSGNVMNIFETEGRNGDLLYYMISGERSYRTDGADILTLHPGEAIFIPIGTKYTSTVVSVEDSEGIFIDFTLSSGGETVYIDEPFRVISDDRLRRRFEAVAENRPDRLRVRAELYRLLSDISSAAASDGLSQADKAVRDAMREIGRHPGNELDVSRIARECCLSETGFRSRFKECSGGYAPTEYRNRMRVERADELLLSGEFTVAQVAEQLGFYDTAHFYRIYRRIRGHSPLRK